MTTAKKAPVAAKASKTSKTTAPAPAPAKPAVAPAAKVAPKAASPVKPIAEPVAKLAKPDGNPNAAKLDKPKKPRLMRDSFTIPKAEYTVLGDLKQRAIRLTSPAKKSELLRAGIKALAAMPDAAFLGALRAVPAIKTGRPSKT